MPPSYDSFLLLGSGWDRATLALYEADVLDEFATTTDPEDPVCPLHPLFITLGPLAGVHHLPLAPGTAAVFAGGYSLALQRTAPQPAAAKVRFAMGCIIPRQRPAPIACMQLDLWKVKLPKRVSGNQMGIARVTCPCGQVPPPPPPPSVCSLQCSARQILL